MRAEKRFAIETSPGSHDPVVADSEHGAVSEHLLGIGHEPVVGGANHSFAIVKGDGTAREPRRGAAGPLGSDEPRVPPSRFTSTDDATLYLGYLAATWQDMQTMRKAADQRGLGEGIVTPIKAVEDKLGRELSKALRKHPIWPWLSQFPGLGGVHTARLISRIGNPHRFPGQRCSHRLGHTVVPDFEVGSPCPVTNLEGEFCPGVMLSPRTTTGVRSLWHYCGLHVVDGRSPRKSRGVRCDWDPICRTAILQPDGIADHIVRNRVEPYRSQHPTQSYDAAKARLIERERVVADKSLATDLLSGDTRSDRERGADAVTVNDRADGSALASSVVDPQAESEHGVGDGTAEEADRPAVFADCHGPLRASSVAEKVPESESVAGDGTAEGVGQDSAIEGLTGPLRTSSQRAVHRTASEAADGPLRPFQIDALARKIAAKAFVGDLLMAWKASA